MEKIIGLEKCPRWLRLKYLESTNYECQVCHKKFHEKDLEIHRIHRGNKKGLYTLYPLNHKLNNVKILCKSCHKKIHSNELGVTKH